jgi:hypothetical protein
MEIRQGSLEIHAGQVRLQLRGEVRGAALTLLKET